MTRRFAWLVVIAFVSLFAPARAETPDAYAVLAAIPSDVFAAGYPAGSPMRSGMNGANRTMWVAVGEQTGGIIPFVYGVVRGDTAVADRYVSVIYGGFSHQLPDGSFAYPPTIDGAVQGRPAELTGAAFFLATGSLAFVVARESPLASRYAKDIDTLMPRFRTALSYLSQPQQTQPMAYADHLTANRLFFDAAAFFIGEQFATMPQLHAAGVAFLDQALAMQAPEGYFRELGGPDTSYNAISCLNLAEIAIFVPDKGIRRALDRAVAWELSRVHPDGLIDETGNTRTGGDKRTPEGTKYVVDYPQVVRMFALVGALEHDVAATDAARRIARFHQEHPEV